MEKWRTIRTETLLDTPWVQVRRDAVALPNGQQIDDFYVVGIHDAAAVVALDTQGNIVLKREYRYCQGCDLLEVPAGTFEQHETDALGVARRELLEETGYASEDWTYLGATVESSAKLTNRMHLFVARDCVRIAGQKLDDTEELDVVVMPLAEAVERVMRNDICCNSSAHAILRVARMLGV